MSMPHQEPRDLSLIQYPDEATYNALNGGFLVPNSTEPKSAAVSTEDTFQHGLDVKRPEPLKDEEGQPLNLPLRNIVTFTRVFPDDADVMVAATFKEDRSDETSETKLTLLGAHFNRHLTYLNIKFGLIQIAPTIPTTSEVPRNEHRIIIGNPAEQSELNPYENPVSGQLQVAQRMRAFFEEISANRTPHL